VREAIRAGKAECVGWYLRDAAEFLGRLQDALDPNGRSEWRLTFDRRRRGKPATPGEQMLRDQAIAMAVWQKSRHKNLKRAIAEVMAERKVSRSTVRRALSPLIGKVKWKP
jgi:hypothetical protein